MRHRKRTNVTVSKSLKNVYFDKQCLSHAKLVIDASKTCIHCGCLHYAKGESYFAKTKECCACHKISHLANICIDTGRATILNQQHNQSHRSGKPTFNLFMATLFTQLK